MSSDDDEWTPRLGPDHGVDFKWGLNAESGEFTVWQVGGPGDGFPSHRDALAEAWGRAANLESGDVLGAATATDDMIAIVVYRAGNEHDRRPNAPVAVLEWARTTYLSRPAARRRRHPRIDRPSTVLPAL